MKKAAKSAAERQKEFRKAQKERGRFRMEIWVTAEEKIAVNYWLERYRREAKT